MQNEIKKMKSKKSQQEIAGFVAIILVIVVVSIVLFSFSLQKSLRKPSYYEDIRVNDLMNSIMHYTTDCDYADVKKVIEKCYNDEKCANENACNYLNKLLGQILNSTLGIEKEYGNIIGYQLFDESKKINITNGNTKGNLVVSHYLVPIFTGTTTNNVKVTLYIYFGKIS